MLSATKANQRYSGLLPKSPFMVQLTRVSAPSGVKRNSPLEVVPKSGKYRSKETTSAGSAAMKVMLPSPSVALFQAQPAPAPLGGTEVSIFMPGSRRFHTVHSFQCRGSATRA